MMGIGFPELMIILVIIMIIFGAGKLPEIGSAFGNSIRNFKKSMKDAEQENEELPEGAETAETAITEGESDAEGEDDPSAAETPISSTTETEQK
tara:strand:- start:522 stop:803 length:282 start_codon:yes stop_codon:yes gene_type:complete